MRCKRAAAVATAASSALLKKGSGSSVTLASSGSPGASVVDPSSHSTYSKQRPNSNHPCYQTSSLNENSAKKLCRKQHHALIAHTETQLVSLLQLFSSFLKGHIYGLIISDYIDKNVNKVIHNRFIIKLIFKNYIIKGL